MYVWFIKHFSKEAKLKKEATSGDYFFKLDDGL